MPSVPGLPQYSGLQVEARALKGGQQESIISPEMLNAGAREQMRLGGSLQQAGGGLSAIAGKMQEQDNLQKVQSADALYKEKLQDFETDVKTNRVGVAADGISKDFEEWHQKTLGELSSKNLGNDAQRATFGTLANKNRLMARGGFADFELGEKRKVQKAAFSASLQTERDMGALAPTEGLALDRKLNIVKNIHAFSAAQQLPDEQRQALISGELAGFHAARITSIVDKNPAGAMAYYTANQGEILDVKTRAQLEGVLKVGGLKIIAQNFADQVDATGLGEAEALKAARSKFKGEEEEAIVHEIKTRFGEQSQARERGQKTASDAAWQAFSKRGRLGDIPAATLAAMDGRDLGAIKTHAQSLVEGRQAKTDPNVYYDLRKLAAGEPAVFQSLDLRRHLDKLSPADFREFAKLQTDTKGLKDAATLDAQLSQVHNELGWKGSDREKKGAFDKRVTDAVNDEQQRRGKQLDYTERRKLIERMALDGEVLSGAWYKPDTDRKFYEVAGTADAANFAPSIPKTERLKIEDSIRRAGKPVTPAEVLRLFKLKNGIQ